MSNNDVMKLVRKLTRGTQEILDLLNKIDEQPVHNIGGFITS